MNGYAAAALAVLISASYPVATRAGVTGSFDPHELVALRFGVGALLFLPYLLLHLRAIPRGAWLQGVPLTAFQGAGMAALVICGLQFAPASHAAALGPGANPAWVALFGFIVFARRPSARVVTGVALCASGVLLLVLWSLTGLSASVLAGDAMFLAASALGALYVLQMRSWGVNAIQAAAIVSLYSALIVVPCCLWYCPEPLWRVAPRELLWQALWQGVLIGCVSFVALNHAIARLGAERSSALAALVPVVSAALGIAFLDEIPSLAETAAFLTISAGVTIAAMRAAPSGGQPGGHQRVDEAHGMRAGAAGIARS
jgi:drug/metabolite transporter (DMT)-like permease